MTFNLKIFFATACVVMTGVMAQAQRRLPESHSTQHNTLIAKQTPTINPFKIENNDLLLNQVKEREAMDLSLIHI